MNDKNYAVFEKQGEWKQISIWMTLGDARHYKTLCEKSTDTIFCICIKIEETIRG